MKAPEMELNECLDALSAECKEAYAVCETIATHSCTLLRNRHLQKAGEIVQRLWRIYNSARSNRTRTAIEKVYLYRIGDTIFTSNRREDLLALLPATFRNLLMKEMTTFGI